MDTYSSKLCVSICTDIFLSGDIRTVEPGTRLGFHKTDLVIKDDYIFGNLTTNKRVKYYTILCVSEIFTEIDFNIYNKIVWYPPINN